MVICPRERGTRGSHLNNIKSMMIQIVFTNHLFIRKQKIGQKHIKQRVKWDNGSVMLKASFHRVLGRIRAASILILVPSPTRYVLTRTAEECSHLGRPLLTRPSGGTVRVSRQYFFVNGYIYVPYYFGLLFFGKKMRWYFSTHVGFISCAPPTDAHSKNHTGAALERFYKCFCVKFCGGVLTSVLPSV